MLKIPGSSQIIGTATYDNTSGNPHNPNTPPQTICGGFNTTDEMFVIYYLYTMYQNGDENLDLDSLMMSGMTNISELILEKNNELSIFPNPSNGEFNIDLSTFEGKELIIEVFDINGKVISSKTISNSYGNSYRLDLSKMKNTSSLFFIKIGSNLNEIRYGKIILN